MRTSALWGLALGAGLWIAALFLAPVCLTSSNRALSFGAAAVYAAGSHICHQRPERSFSVRGRQMPVCARCTGLYVSAAAGAPIAILLAASVAARRARWILAVAAAPTLITWSLEYAGVAHFSNAIRAACALPLGLAAAWLVISALRDTMR